MFDSKAKLEAQVYDSIGEMVRAYAQEAVNVARAQHQVRLDFTPASVAVLEQLLEGQGDVDLEFQSRLWGSYFGEVMRFRWDGAWSFSQYPGGVAAVPTLEVRGSKLFPTIKVYRRLTMGKAEDIQRFFEMVTTRLETGPHSPRSGTEPESDG